MKRINRENIADHLVEYQLAFINKTLQEAIDNPNWLTEWSMDPEDHEKFREYAIALIKKVFKCNTNRAKSTFGWFNFQFGLKILKKE